MRHLNVPPGRRIVLAIICVVTLAVAGRATAGIPALKVEVGAISRTVEIDMSAAPPPRLMNWQELVGHRHGGGDIKLYDGNGRVDYLDGGLFESSAWAVLDLHGSTGVSVHHNSQISGQRVLTGGEVDYIYGRATFHSDRYDYRSVVGQTPLVDSESDQVVAPYIAVYCPLPPSRDDGPLFVVCRYSFADAHVRSPWKQTACQAIIQKHREYYFGYDVAMWRPWQSTATSLPNAPFSTPVTGGNDHEPVAIYDAALANYWNGYDSNPFRDPSMRVGGSEKVIEKFRALTQVDVDTQLHEFLLGLQTQVDLGHRVHAGLTAGPTLNIIDWDVRQTTRWVNSAGAQISSSSTSDSHQKVKVGALCQGDISCDLDASGKYFLSLFGGYAWLDTVKAQTGPAAAVIDFSSWFFGGGVGVTL